LRNSYKTTRLICSFLAISVLCAAADEPKALFQQAQQIMEKDPADRDVNKAISLLKHATAAWQAASSKDPDYVAALDYLAVSLMVQLRENAAEQDENKLADFGEWIKRAAPYTKRALEISESNPAIDPDVLALALELQAQLEGQQGRGAALWDRAAKIRTQRVAALSPADPAISPIVRAGDANAIGPRSISIPKPTYTRIGLLAQYTGVVQLKAVVGLDGKAHNIELVRGLGFGLDEQAAKALLLSRFEPGQKDGQPVPTGVDLEVKFQLN
jgi:TonB-like protein